VFRACEIILSFSVMFCVVRPVHTFDFRFVINGKRNKWRPVFVSKFAGSNSAEAVGILRAKKCSARLPSDG